MRLRPFGIAMIALTTAITASLFAIAPASADDTGNTATDALSLTANMPTTTAMFTPSNIVPGQSGSNTITITANAAAVGAVKVYAANASDPSQIAQYFTLTITEGTKKKGGTFTAAADGTVYTGSLAHFLTKDISYPAGVGTWAPDGTADASKTYQIIWTLNPTAPNTAQGKTVSTSLAWEIQSTGNNGNTSTALASTGSDTAILALSGIAALLLTAGLLLVLLVRRRRSGPDPQA